MPTTHVSADALRSQVRGAAEHTWWQDAVIYQVYIRSFADGDGDGVGDLQGLRSRLLYLRDLGVDAVWITPFYPSPMADGGYDVADYRDIEPTFGTLAEADALIAEAHRLGLRLLLDLVPNHTSDRHAWFEAALQAGPGSPERNRYIFRKGRGAAGKLPPNDWMSVFGGPAWERVADGEWYLHLFDVAQPDLNWDNDEVRQEFEDILRFWLDRGIDGFRIDVAHGLAKDPDLPDLANAPEVHPFWNRSEVHEIYRRWRSLLSEYDSDPILVAEAWVHPPQELANYVRPDELHQAFNFDFLQSEWDAGQLRSVIDSCLHLLGSVGAPVTWVLSNHDVKRVVTRYGGGSVGLRRARAASLLMLALPGGAYIYQGEELGLFEVDDLPTALLQDPIWRRSAHKERGRDGCRVPIPWNEASPSYGFGPAGSWLPQPPAWADLAVDRQEGDLDSTLELYRSALGLRRSAGRWRGRGLRWIDSPPGTLVFARGDELACAVNLSSRPVKLPYGEPMLASAPVTAARPGHSVLPPDTAAWFRLG